MKIFGLSPAAAVVSARLPGAQVVPCDGDDFATAPAVVAWPSDITAAERTALEEIFRPWGWAFGKIEVVSALGLVRAADARLPSVLAIDRARPVTVVSLRGWREWSGHTIAQGLMAAGISAQAVDVQMQATPVDASLHQMATRFEDAVFRTNLLSEVQGAQQLLFPPVLGTGHAVTRLQDAAGCPVGEAVATLPSLAGEAQLLIAQKKWPHVSGDARALLADTLASNDEAIVASRRAAAWVERLTGAPPPSADKYRDAPVHACGRARAGVRGLGAEWLSALRLCAQLGAA